MDGSPIMRVLRGQQVGIRKIALQFRLKPNQTSYRNVRNIFQSHNMDFSRIEDAYLSCYALLFKLLKLAYISQFLPKDRNRESSSFRIQRLPPTLYPKLRKYSQRIGSLLMSRNHPNYDGPVKFGYENGWPIMRYYKFFDLVFLPENESI